MNIPLQSSTFSLSDLTAASLLRAAGAPVPAAVPQSSSNQPASPQVVEAPPPAAVEPHDMTVLSTHPSGAPKEVVLPADPSSGMHAVSGSRAIRYAMGGTVAGTMAGTYLALSLLPGGGALMGAAMGGGAVLGGIMGYMAAKG